MKKLVLTIAALAGLLVTECQAQLTGPSSIAYIHDGTKTGSYKVERDAHSVTFRDAMTGAEVFKASEVNAQTVTLVGFVASLRNLSPEQKEQLLKKVAFYNFSSPVGTLLVDSETGDITMEHHLNPRHVSPSSMATVASRFGDAVRSESQSLLQW